MILGTLSVVDMGLAAVGIPHEKGGVQAAIDCRAGVLSHALRGAVSAHHVHFVTHIKFIKRVSAFFDLWPVAVASHQNPNSGWI